MVVIMTDFASVHELMAVTIGGLIVLEKLQSSTSMITQMM